MLWLRLDSRRGPLGELLCLRCTDAVQLLRVHRVRGHRTQLLDGSWRCVSRRGSNMLGWFISSELGMGNLYDLCRGIFLLGVRSKCVCELRLGDVLG